MKTKNFLTFILLIVTLLSCGGQEVEDARQRAEVLKSGKKANGYFISIIEFDSCEYLISGYGYSQMMTHKGNCKFCAKRNCK